MERFISQPDRQVWASRLDRPYEFESPFDGQAFALLLMSNDELIQSADQSKLCDQIVQQGCRYAVCAGFRCESWHDMIDWAYLATDPNFNPPESTHIMTTWHENEPLSETVEFFAWTTWFQMNDEMIRPERFLIICVGGDGVDFAKVCHACIAQFLP